MPEPQGCDRPLTPEDRRKLAEDNIDVVDLVLSKSFHARNRDDLYDVGMEALVVASRDYDHDAAASFRSFAHTCIRNKILNHLDYESAAKRCGAIVDRDLDDIESSGVSAEDLAASRDESLRVWVAIGRVHRRDTRAAAIVAMRHGLCCAAMSLQAIAETVGIHRRQVNELLAEGEQALREELCATRGR